MSERPYLSIGEVLGLLLEEFSDVTISKIRFLESQGLIDPERTTSGYRKFYDGDVERLRYILREQKDNYLPLKVIKERLDDLAETPANPPRPVPTGATWMAGNGLASDQTVSAAAHSTAPPDLEPTAPIPITSAQPAPPSAPAATPTPPATPAPAARRDVEPDPPAETPPTTPESAATPAVRGLDVVRTPSPGDGRLTATELCEQARITARVLRELEEFGLIHPKAMGTDTSYGSAALRIAELARDFMAAGLEVRHLRAWRMAAEKEAGLFEQLVVPLLRQRNPQARRQATETLHQLSALGGELRTLMVRQSLAEFLDG